MYQKYNTEALVFSDRELGESDRVFVLYTRDFGLLRARASAVRKETSRMRYALQKYSHADVSLIRGMRGWRLAGASSVASAPPVFRGVQAFARLVKLGERLIAPEEQNTYLFDALSDAHTVLHEDKAPVAPVELITAARMLHVLGYLSIDAAETALFAHTAYGPEDIHIAEARREILLASVNRAIAATQL